MSITRVCLRGLWLEYIKGSGSKFSFIPDWWPCRLTDLFWGRRLHILDQLERGDGGERGRDGEKMRWNLGQKGGKARAKVNLKRMSAGGRSRGAWLPQWTLNISLWFWSICSVAVSPGFCVWLCFWSSELTPDPGFWPYPLPPATPSRLANMCYLVWTHTLTRTYLYSNTKTQSHMYTRKYLMYRELKKRTMQQVYNVHTTFAHPIVCPQLIPPRGASVCHCLSP